MTRTSPPQVAFSSGEIAPLLHRRIDYQRFQTGLAACRGFVPLPEGGFTRAPGTIWRGSTRGNEPAALIPFQFAANDALVLEFTAGFMRVWRYGALVMDGAVPYELATPYGADALAHLSWVQSADVIYLADGQQPVQKLSRFALDNWTIADATFAAGPFRVQNLDEARTITASAATGSITLTAAPGLFVAAHVGSLMMLQAQDYADIPLWSGNTTVSVGQLMRYDGQVYELITGTNTGVNPPQHREGTEQVSIDPVVKWKWVSDGIGVVRITAVASATSATATVLKALPSSVVSAPTYRWSEGAWSTLYGYPGALELYDQRLVAAATPSDPRTIWFSSVGDYQDFEPGTEPDSAFAYSISGQTSLNKILSLKAGRGGLHIFALGQEYSTRSDSRTQAIGPTSVVIGLDSDNGASGAVPIAPDGDPIFISRDRQRVLAVSYSFQDDANRTSALSRPAQHLGAERFEQIVWQASPQRIAWLRRASGDLVAMIHEPSEEVLGWAVLPIAGGFAEAMAVAPDDSGTQDTVSVVVRRVIDGVTVRMVEELAPIYGVLTGSEAISEAVHYFASVVFDLGAPASTFSLPHLVGETVYAWTDQGEFGPLTVPVGGALDLPVAVSKGCIGLFDDTHYAETLDIQAAAPDGNSMGRRKRLDGNFAVALHRSAQGYIRVVERDFAQPERLRDRQTLVPRQVAADLTTAHSGIARVELSSGQSTELALRIQPYSGAPLTVTAIVPTVQEAGR